VLFTSKCTDMLLATVWELISHQSCLAGLWGQEVEGRDVKGKGEGWKIERNAV